MIRLVLHEFRFGLRHVRPLVSLAVLVPVRNADRQMSTDHDEKVGEGHAVVPHRERFGTAMRDDGVDDRPRPAPEVQRDHPLRDADLRGRDPPAESLFFPECVERVLQPAVFLDEFEPRKIRHDIARPPQAGIPQQQNRIGHSLTPHSFTDGDTPCRPGYSRDSFLRYGRSSCTPRRRNTRPGRTPGSRPPRRNDARVPPGPTSSSHPFGSDRDTRGSPP